MQKFLGMTVCAVLACSWAQGAETKSPCAPEARQFDFWVGEWNVTTAEGQQAGTNSIRLILDDCVLQETWAGAAGRAD